MRVAGKAKFLPSYRDKRKGPGPQAAVQKRVKDGAFVGGNGWFEDGAGWGKRKPGDSVLALELGGWPVMKRSVRARLSRGALRDIDGLQVVPVFGPQPPRKHGLVGLDEIRLLRPWETEGLLRSRIPNDLPAANRLATAIVVWKPPPGSEEGLEDCDYGDDEPRIVILEDDDDEITMENGQVAYGVTAGGEKEEVYLGRVEMDWEPLECVEYGYEDEAGGGSRVDDVD